LLPGLQACFHRAVTILCREMALSFTDQGEDLPPWRTAQALLSRWHLSCGTASGPGECSAWAHRGAAGQGAAADLFGAKLLPAFGAD
jgi:hypothetical protein